MRRKLAVFFGLGAILVLAGAGCANQGVSLYTQNTTTPDTGGVVTVSATNAGWSHYENKKYGVTFDYPPNWTRADNMSEDFLSVRLGNADCASEQCPPEFVGVEIRAGVKKINFTDLFDWVKNKIVENNKTGLLPNGKMETIDIGGHSALRVEKSDWAGASAGPAFYLNQDQNYYIYISTGRNDVTAGALDAVNKVIGSVRVLPNSLPIPDLDQGDNTDSVLPPEVRNGKLYTNAEFKFNLRYPEVCPFHNNSDQVYPPVQVELWLCGKNEDDGIISVKVVSSTVDQEVKNAFGGRRLKYYQNMILVSDQKGILVSFTKGYRNNPERYVIVGRDKWVYVLSVKNDVKDYAAKFDEVLAGFEATDW